MKKILTAVQMKEADRRTMEEFGMPSAVLMERAALALRDQVRIVTSKMSSQVRILVLCGAGNNGGDGFAVARLLLLDGYPVDIWFAGDENRMSTECRRQKDIFHAYSEKISGVDFGAIYNRKPDGEYHIIIDALFGVGLTRDVKGSYAEALDAVNAMDGYKIAADIPSGVSSDTGVVLGTAFRADLTVTFGFMKRGLFFYPGKELCGTVVLDDVGIQELALGDVDCMYALEREDIQKLLPPRSRVSHKGTYGKVLVIAGSESMSGAAYLSAKAAYTSGAGLVRIYTHRANHDILAGLLPETLLDCYDSFSLETLQAHLSWADVVIIGPGLSKYEISVNLVKETLCHSTKPCIIDADAVNILAEHPEFAEQRTCKTVLTPHMMEMSRLTGESVRELTGHRLESIERVLDTCADVCVLKDAVTMIGDRFGRTYVNTSGNSALSKGGSGDVLTGILGGLIAQGMELTEAAALAVFLHGCAGEKMSSAKGYYSVLASDLMTGLTELLREFGDEK
jgi:NAD(P)H-hydrate epimerase